MDRPYALIGLGVTIGLAGSFSSALGYFVIKNLHNDVEDRIRSSRPELRESELKRVSRSEEYKYGAFYLGFLLLILGAVASTTNLGLLGQTAIAPFAAFGTCHSRERSETSLPSS